MAKEIRQDFLLNKDGDFPLQDTVINGVYSTTPYGDSDSQHILDLIEYNFGSLKSNPLNGFGINLLLNSEINIQSATKKINTELDKDGYFAKNNVIYPTSINGGGYVFDLSNIKRK